MQDQIMSLLSSPVPHGILGSVIIYLFLKIRKIESKHRQYQDLQNLLKEGYLDQQTKLINNYVDLVKVNADVLAKLTICMNSMKDAINGLKDTVDRLKG